MERMMTRRRVLTLARALALVMLTSAPTWAQARVYWSIPLTGGARQIWSMNPDGSGQANLFPSGLTPPATYSWAGDVAGPSAGVYPIDPAVPGSPSVRWWVASLSGPDSTAVFAFAPNGQGGAVWRRLTDLPRTPTPDVSRSITGRVTLPTGPSDAFVSFQILEAVFNGTAWTSTYSLARFADPFTRPAGSATLDQLQLLTSAAPGAEPGSHTWSPDGRVLAYVGSQAYPNGSTRRALRLLDTATGADVFLFDTNTAGIQPNRPRWSNSGQEIAFDSNTYSGTASGTYAVNPSSGAIRAIATGSTTDFSSTPVWSPDGTALVVSQSYQGTKANLKNRGLLARVPSSGVTKKSPAVPLTTNSEAFQVPIPLGWR